MRARGKDLIFISQINRDGTGTTSVESSRHMNRDWFTVTCLSMTRETYIASGLNSFVVKVKDIKELISKNTSEYGN